MIPEDAIREATALIETVSGYERVAHDLRQRRVIFDPRLPDRGQASLRGTIRIGAETLQGTGELLLVSLAGTLVHEHWHTRQNPFLKTVSFWKGVFSRTHPMRHYEWPAYERQLSFLEALARSHPTLARAAASEQEAVRASFAVCYQQEP